MALINYVEWKGDNKTFAWRYPHDNLSTYTQLKVAASQEAVLFSKGQMIQKFGPGLHTLDTENIPLLRSLFSIPFGGKNPFTAEVWFVNKQSTLNIDWRTDSMKIHDPDYGSMIPLFADGRYGLKVDVAERFLEKLVGSATSYSAYDLTDHFQGELVSKTKSVISQFMSANRVGLKNISSYLDAMSNNLRDIMVPFWKDFGFELVGFYVNGVDVDPNDPTGANIIDAIARQSAQNIGGYTWQQSQMFETAQGALGGSGNGSGGLLGAVLAANMMGSMGSGSGNGMGSGVMQPNYDQPSFSPNPNMPTPPPVGGYKQAPGQTNQAEQQAIKEVYCSNCSKKFPVTMKFCPHCGDKYNACPNCGTDNPENAKRCTSCGIQLAADAQSRCEGCGSPVAEGAAFCPNCGRPRSEGKCSRCGAPTKNMSFCPQCGNKLK